jgi:hypothetical protein
MTSVTEVPYFDGDYWPNVLEEAIEAEKKDMMDEQGIEPDINEVCFISKHCLKVIACLCC